MGNKVILDIINEDVDAMKKTEAKEPSHYPYSSGYEDALGRAVFDWLPAAGYSESEIDDFQGEKADVVDWMNHEAIKGAFLGKSYLDGFIDGADKAKELLGFQILYIVEGDYNSDCEGMIFAVCTTKDSAETALNMTFGGEDVHIREVIADTVVIDDKVIRTK